MDFSTLSQYPVTFTYEVKDPAGAVIDSCEVTCDANKFTGELDRRMGGLYAERVREIDTALKLRAAQPSPNGTGKKAKGRKPDNTLLKMADDVVRERETDAKLADLRREMVADALASDRYGVLIKWGVERPPTFENLMLVPESRLEDLLKQCREAARPKEQPATTKGGRSAGRAKGTTTLTSDSSEVEMSTTRQPDELLN